MIEDRLRKGGPDFVPNCLARKLACGLAEFTSKFVVRLRPAREADHRKIRRQIAIGGQIIESGDELPVGEIAGGTEDYDGARLRHRARNDPFTQRIRLLLIKKAIHRRSQPSQALWRAEAESISVVRAELKRATENAGSVRGPSRALCRGQPDPDGSLGPHLSSRRCRASLLPSSREWSRLVCQCECRQV